MRVVITGAGGHLGRAVVTLLVKEGFDVLGVDKVPAHHEHAPIMCVDLCDAGQVFSVLADADAVIHLGAIPSPGGFPPEVVYRNNVLAQFNVYEAAARLGIARVVSASSVAALGFPFQVRWSEPLYFPIDEEHPLLPQDVYALSKANGEEIASAYCRRGQLCAASLRFSTIVDEHALSGLVDDTRVHPESWASSLWSYIEIHDAARACLAALTAHLQGHQPFFITADDTYSELVTDTLLLRWFPGVPRRPGIRSGRWSLLDNSRATRVLGFSPQYRWPGVLDEGQSVS